MDNILKGTRILQQENFPLNKLSPSVRWTVFKESSKGSGLFNSYMVVLEILKKQLVLEERPDWKVLEELIGELDPIIVKQCVISLYYSCVKSQNEISGYLLLNLLKIFFGVAYTPPKVDRCTAEVVEQEITGILNQFDFSDKRSIEFLLLEPYEDEESVILSLTDIHQLSRKITKVLSEIPFNDWKRKEEVLINFFISIDKPHRIKALKELMTSQSDKRTRDIGSLGCQIFFAESLNDALPSLQKIKTLLSGMTENQFLKVFNLPFPTFSLTHSFENNYSLIKLGFDSPSHVVDYHHLIIGSYGAGDCGQWIIAYDKMNHRISWGFRHRGKLVDIKKCDNGIILLLKTGAYEVITLDPISGSELNRLPLSFEKHTKIESFFLANPNFAFFIFYKFGEKYLSGLKFNNNQGKITFQKKFPYFNVKLIGNFLSYSTPNCSLMIIDPKGKSFKIKHGLDIIYKDKRLFIIKNKGERHYIHTYLFDNNDRFKPKRRERKFGISGLRLKFIKALSDGICVCHQFNERSRRLYIVDMNNERIYPCDYFKKFNSQFTFDLQSGNTYAWDSDSKILQMLKLFNCETITSLPEIGDIRFVHVDDKKNLYYVEN